MTTTRPTAINIRAAAKKVAKPAGLTVSKATTQARRVVDKVMPGVMATVDSRGSWDMVTDTQIVITTVTFPRMHDGISDLRQALHSLPGIRDIKTECSSITYSRTK